MQLRSDHMTSNRSDTVPARPKLWRRKQRMGAIGGENARDSVALAPPPAIAQQLHERRFTRLQLFAARLAVLVVALLLWQYLPKIGVLSSRFKFLNPLFISSPSAMISETAHLLTATDGAPSIWSYLAKTIEATLIGGGSGVIVGGVVGLLFSNYRWLSDIAQPYVVAINSIPRIALIPVVILIAGPTVAGTSLSAAIVVVFIIFFNAYEGGRSVPTQMIENVALLGGSRRQVMTRLRAPYVVVWTIAALPNAISFSLIGVVTTEILSGVPGLGYLILQGLTNLDSNLIFAVILILSAAGVLLFVLCQWLAQRVTRGIDLYAGGRRD